MRPRRARLGTFAPCAGTRRMRASVLAGASLRLASKMSPKRGTPHTQSRVAAHKKSICPTPSATCPLLSPRMSRAMHSSGQTCTFHRMNPERVPSAFQSVSIRTPNKIRMLSPRFMSRDLKTRTPSPALPRLHVLRPESEKSRPNPQYRAARVPSPSATIAHIL